MTDEQQVGTAQQAPVDLPQPVPEDVPAPEELEASEQAPDTPPQEMPAAKPRSGFARQKVKLAALAEENRQLRAYLANQEAARNAKPLERPRPEQYTDWEKYQEAEESYREQRDDVRWAKRQQEWEQRQAQNRAVELRKQAYNDFQADCEEFNQDFPDAEQTAQALSDEMGPWKEPILNLLSHARNREVLHYYLTKNPEVAMRLNSMDPISAALTIGELQVKADLPVANKVSKAPPPIHPPRGGASPPSDPYQAAKKDDITAYVRMRRAMDKVTE